MKANKKAKKEQINYRQGYMCSGCQRSGVKLWRDYNTCANVCELKCVECATPAQVAYEAKTYTDENRKFLGALDPDGLFMFRSGDQIGGLVPAVPTPDGDTFWGYSSVPDEDVLWWYGLPTYHDADRELRCLKQLIRKTTDAYVGSRKRALGLRGRVDEARRRLRYRLEWPAALPQLALEELAAIAIAHAGSTDLNVLRQHLLRLMSVDAELGRTTIDLYRQVDDLEWKIERRVFEFTRPTKVLIYDTEVRESEGLRVHVPIERHHDVGRDDRVAFTEGRERAYLLDQNDDSLRKARVIMEHDQDGARWIREQIVEGALTEIRRGYP
jgi:hypothetical protein